MYEKEEEIGRQNQLRLTKMDELDQRLISQIMSTPQGREWMWNILALTKLNINAMKADDRSTAFTLGEQNIGLQLQAKILKHAPAEWILAQQERK
jgi:hypothetical protein